MYFEKFTSKDESNLIGNPSYKYLRLTEMFGNSTESLFFLFVFSFLVVLNSVFGWFTHTLTHGFVNPGPQWS